jgi:hemerythrin HHE cation binding domain-containing protein
MIPNAVARGIPRALQVEHEELREALTQLASETGQIGKAGTEVKALFDSHAAREEQFALPPLGLLAPLAAGAVPPDAPAAIALSRRLRSELPDMLDDHLAIVAALQILLDKANELGRPDAGDVARRLILHAQFEEEVLYPASILVGMYLEARGA